jgi:hypothetical protein
LAAALPGRSPNGVTRVAFLISVLLCVLRGSDSERGSSERRTV